MKGTIAALITAAAILTGCSQDSIQAETITCTETPKSGNKKHDSAALEAGYCGVNDAGITAYIEGIINREDMAESSPGYLFEPSYDDEAFIAMQVLSDSVLYAFDPSKTLDCTELHDCRYDHPAANIKLLIRKVPGETYLEGQPLNLKNLYMLRGLVSYETAIGGTAQAIAFDGVKQFM